MKYIVQRDKGFPVDDNPKPRYAFGETFEPDPDTTDGKGNAVHGALTPEMCAAGVESGYLAMVQPEPPTVKPRREPQPAPETQAAKPE